MSLENTLIYDFLLFCHYRSSCDRFSRWYMLFRATWICLPRSRSYLALNKLYIIPLCCEHCVLRGHRMETYKRQKVSLNVRHFRWLYNQEMKLSVCEDYVQRSKSENGLEWIEAFWKAGRTHMQVKKLSVGGRVPQRWSAELSNVSLAPGPAQRVDLRPGWVIPLLSAQRGKPSKWNAPIEVGSNS